MKSDNPLYSSIELGWAALAWTQFLVIVTTVHREDFHLIRTLLPTFIDTPELIFRDTTPFAGLALLLNAISLGFLESDSTDGTFHELQVVLPPLRREFRCVGAWQRDFSSVIAMRRSQRFTTLYELIARVQASGETSVARVVLRL